MGAAFNLMPLTQAVDYDPFETGGLERVVSTTEPQREIWLAAQLGSEATLSYNESIGLRFSGAFDLDAFRSAMQTLIDRNDAWRCTFSPDGQNMLVHERGVLALEFMDCRALEGPARQAALDVAFRQAVEQPFDLQHGPLVRTVVLQLSDSVHQAVLTAHHLVCDGWSWGVAKRHLAHLYTAKVRAQRSTLPQAPSFADHAAAQLIYEHSSSQEVDEAYWLKKFAQLPPPLDLPLDRPRPRGRSFGARCVVHELDAALVTQLKRAGGRAGASLFTTLLAATGVVLSRLSRTDEIVIGIFSAGQTLSHRDLIGHAVNTLPLRLKTAGSLPFSQVLEHCQGELFDAIEHQSMPLGALLQRLRLPRDSSRAPLVSVVFNLDQPLPASQIEFGGLQVEQTANYRSFDNFELFINAVQTETSVRIETLYNTALFDESTVSGWMQALEVLLRGVTQAPDTPAGRLPLLSDQAASSLARWNDTTSAVDRTLTLGTLLGRQGRDHPDRVAVVSKHGALSFGDLEGQSNQLARWLRQQGVRRGHAVGLMLPRTPDLLVTLLGVLKSGACYVPLDIAYPAERLKHMVLDAQVSMVLVAGEDTLPLTIEGQRFEALSAIRPQWRALPTTALTPDPTFDATADDAAYVIYTSGTTGLPKGVALPHRAVVNFLTSMARAPGLTADDRLLAVTTMSFDIAVLELFLPLTVGAQTVLADRDEALDPRELVRMLTEHDVTTLQATPSLWRLLIAAGWRGTARFKALIGGEALPRDLADALLERVGELWNMYGPTETAVWSTCWRVPGSAESAARAITVGRPIDNTQVWVLNDQGETCPPGMPGEICIGGEGVALGYLRQPELTAEKFVFAKPPLSPGEGLEQSTLLYRTGDLGRWLKHGEVEHLGRIDSQVKLRGHRIELGEIEATLEQLPEVRQAAAVVVQGASDLPTLVVFVVPQGALRVDVKALLEHARSRLPEFMLPQRIVPIDALPLLLNGKLDRKALQQQSLGTPLAVASVPADLSISLAGTSEQMAVSGVWAEVLNLTHVDIDADFFDIGGHSMLAIRLLLLLEQRTGKRLTLTNVLEAPTVRKMAELLQSPEGPRHGDQLVLLRPGPGTPVFLLHDGDGEVLLYRNLALGLHAQHAVYGVKPHSDADVPLRSTRIAEMATRLMAAIVARQPAGPYLLGGLCAGGVLAFEVARQLEAVGKDVALVALLDAANPLAPLRTGRIAEARLRRFGAAFQVDPSLSLGKHLVHSVARIGRKLGNVASFEIESRLGRLQAHRMFKQLRAHLEDGAPLSDEARALTFRQIYTFAEDEYVPKLVKAPLLLLRATQGDGSEADKPEVEDHTDADLGWGSLTVQGLSVVDVSGGHSTMLQEPHIASTLLALQSHVDRVLAVRDLTRTERQQSARGAA